MQGKHLCHFMNLKCVFHIPLYRCLYESSLIIEKVDPAVLIERTSEWTEIASFLFLSLSQASKRGVQITSADDMTHDTSYYVIAYCFLQIWQHSFYFLDWLYRSNLNNVHQNAIYFHAHWNANCWNDLIEFGIFHISHKKPAILLFSFILM